MIQYILTISIIIFVVGAIDLNRLGKDKPNRVTRTYDVKNAKQLFAEFVEKYNKEYEHEEYQYRYDIFVKNLEEINEWNNKSNSTVYGITKFVDLTHEEFLNKYTGFAVSGRRSDSNNTAVDVKTLLKGIEVPDEFDWRDKGAVTEVKDQDICGSSWAFSATGTAEGQNAIHNSKLISLSEKQMMDCWPYSGGCFSGNFPDYGLNAVAEMGGFMSEIDYPFRPTQDNCSFQKEKVVVRIKRGDELLLSNEEDLKKLVYEKGPVSVGLYAGKGFGSYKGGIFEGPDCTPGQAPNHYMLVVGYGVENGTPYWIIKNSYGVNWGAQGYLKLIRGREACSLMIYVALAEVE